MQFDIIVDCPSISVSQSPMTNPQVAVGDSVIGDGECVRRVRVPVYVLRIHERAVSG